MTRLPLIGVLVLCSLSSPALGEPFFWDGNGNIPPNGIFGVANNGSPNQAPFFVDQVTFLDPNVYTVTFNDHAVSDSATVDSGDVSFRSDSSTVRV